MLHIKPSKIHGNGCYTSSEIKKGMVVASWKGEMVSTPAQPGEKYYGYYIRVGDKWLVPDEGPEKNINHSCDPNTMVMMLKDGVEFIAAKDIKIGEEISFDYGTVIPEGDTFMISCKCGAENCRGIIKGPSKAGASYEEYDCNFEQVVAFKAGALLESYGKISANGLTFLYDIHEVNNGVNVSVDIVPWRTEPIGVDKVPRWIDSSVFLMPYSGFCFPRRSLDVNENYQFDAGKDDHLFYQGSEIRGVEILAFGKTKQEALQRATESLLRPDIQKLITTFGLKNPL
ncbi:MAG: SET domain-containing protein [Nitrososphaerales archaeon]